jgi:hypothetical protein
VHRITAAIIATPTPDIKGQCLSPPTSLTGYCPGQENSAPLKILVMQKTERHGTSQIELPLDTKRQQCFLRNAQSSASRTIAPAPKHL